MSFRAHLSMAGFGLALLYAIIGVVALIGTGDGRTALVFAISAVVTAALVAILLPLIAPRGGGDSDDDEGGGPGGGGGDGPPPPPWWPQFEREFWSHVNREPPSEPSGERERQRSTA